MGIICVGHMTISDVFLLILASHSSFSSSSSSSSSMLLLVLVCGISPSVHPSSSAPCVGRLPVVRQLVGVHCGQGTAQQLVVLCVVGLVVVAKGDDMLEDFWKMKGSGKKLDFNLQLGKSKTNRNIPEDICGTAASSVPAPAHALSSSIGRSA